MGTLSINENDSLTSGKQKKHMGIFARLMLGFSAVTLFFLIAIGITLSVITVTKNYSEKVIHVDIPVYDALIDLNNEIYMSHIATQALLISGDAKFAAKLNQLLDDISRSVQTIDKFSTSWNNAGYQQRWDEIKALLNKLKIVQQKISDASLKTDKTAAIEMLHSESSPLQEKVGILLNSINTIGTATPESAGLIDLLSNELNAGSQKIIENLNVAQWMEYLLSVIGIIVAIIFALLTARSVLRHVNIFRQHSSRIASGDLTRFIEIDSLDEMGLLGNDLNKMTDSLAGITREITQSCHHMFTSLEEVRHAVDMQSSGASEQASSINEITASLSEIEKSSAQTKEKAKSLGETAERTREKGKLGLDAVDQSVNGMNEIRDKVQMIAQTILDLSQQTQKIGEITTAVNGLAQQSKMLALNASIEAAKAGEAGKGFAVVAIEVKNLAEQSEQATTQVQKILENIRYASEKAVMVTEEGTKGVEHGTNLVEQTGEVIRSLNEVIHETTIASQQIESAVRQESAGIEQITTGMNEINQVTHSFVESVKQTTEAIGNLSEIVKNLKSCIDTYKI
ncbi:MAG TPA: methyl-accepting chemotaxis protein [Gammaproteobacteria bacterium]|nr:methyl-accepting chemotaxis protein [Gammaproteobacteria bacterium]